MISIMIKFASQRLKIIPVLVIIFSATLSPIAFGINGKMQKGASAAVLVKAAVVTNMEFFELYSAVGQLKNEESRTYYANVNGIVENITKKQGGPVNKGDIILVIDQKIAEGKKSQAQANFDAAFASYEREKTLFSKKFNSNDVIEKAKAHMEAARSDLTASMKLYDDMVISAPFSGEVGVISLQVGDQVKIGEPLFTITKDSIKAIFLQVPELLFNKIPVGTEAIILDYSNKKAKGEVQSVSGYLSDNGTITLKVTTENSGAFAHGSYVKVNLILNKHTGLAIPERAVLKNDKGNYVYLITPSNEIKQQYIELGIRLDGMIEVQNGSLSKGDKIVLDGLTKVYEGTKVQEVQDQDSSNQDHLNKEAVKTDTNKENK